MRLTDLTMIFIVILLPIVIAVSVSTAFVVTAQKHELYTKTVIDSSVRDAVDSMKKVENKESNVNYGYSNEIIGKISVDPKIAVNTFFNSMALNLGAVNDEFTADYLRAYVPVIVIMDYDGLYAYSVDGIDGTNLTHTIKPKVYFNFTYCIADIESVMDAGNLSWTDEDGITYDVIVSTVAEISSYYAVVPYKVAIQNNLPIYGNLIYNIKYTQDMYVYLDVFKNVSGTIVPIKKCLESNVDLSNYNTGFYLDDDKSNIWLIGERWHLYRLANPINDVPEIDDETEENGGIRILSEVAIKNLRDNAKQLVQSKKAETITRTCQNHILAAVKNHNKVCSNLGLNYEFKYEPDMSSYWYEKNKGVGLIVMVQGLKSGNSYINYTLNNISTVGISTKYYISERVQNPENVVYTYKNNEEVTVEGKDIKKYTEDIMYYHADEKCPLYKAYISVNEDDEHAITLAPGFFYTEAEAVANGFRSCPVCKP